jgi:hypothetical protein
MAGWKCWIGTVVLCPLTRSLEELYFAFVLLRGGPCSKRPEVSASARLRIDLPRIYAEFARFQFSNHVLESSTKVARHKIRETPDGEEHGHSAKECDRSRSDGVT